MPQSFVKSSIREVLDAALLANAAAIDMSPGDYATETSLNLTLRNALTFSDSRRFTDAEADYVTSRFRVETAIRPFVDLLATATGFNASLWRRLGDLSNPDGQYTIAFGGTNDVQDVGVNLLIARTGAALGQVQALDRWVTSLYTGITAGGLGLLDRFDEVDLTGHSLGGHLVQWAAGEFHDGTPDSIWLPNTPFTDGYTFNGAGINSPLGAVWGIARLPVNIRSPGLLLPLQLYGVARTLYQVVSGNYLFNDGNGGLENYISSAGLDIIPSILTGVRPGEDFRIFTEDQNERSVVGEGNHFIRPLIDSLFVHNVFEGFAGIDAEGRTQLDLGQMRNILQASSNNPFESLERVVNHVRDLLPGTSVSGLPDANIDPPEGSDGTMQALAIAIAQELEDNPRDVTILDIFRQGPNFVGDRALNDDDRGLAYRVALMEAQPFILFGLDYQQAFNQDGSFDRDNFTERFLRDRAAYAAALFKANAEDVPLGGQVSVFQENRYFENRLGDFEQFFAVDDDEPPPVNTLAQVFFGGDSADTYTGGDENDSIYGLDGNDTLEGGLGDDYIEGGDGDDELTGGEGSNTLLGGEGTDLYRIGVTERVDITDSDGQGSILVERPDGTSFQLGSQAINAVANMANVYRDDEGFTYVLDGTTLSISGPDGAQIVIREFDPGIIPLGIDLQGFRAFVPPGDPVVFDVDVVNPPPGDGLSNQYISQFGRYNNATQNWSSAGVWFFTQDWEAYQITGADDAFRTEVINATAVPDGALNGSLTRFYQINGGFGDSYITGDDGFNEIRDDSALWPTSPYIGFYGMGPVMGDDVILGLGGNDWIGVSGGDDFVEGGAGDDFISSSHAGFDVSIAINGDPPFTFTPYGDVSWVAQPGNSSDDRLFGGAGNDFIIAHGGNQIMDGGADDDELFGGAGNDVLIGGAGNDVLSGDTRAAGPLTELAPGTVPADFEFVFVGDNLTFDASDPEQWGNDTLDGGDGDDVLYGGAGDDSLVGGDGDDRLQGDFVFAYADLRQGLQNRPTDPSNIHGDDILLGGAGNDQLLGYGGDDLIEGGDDDDIAAGGEGSDIVRGDAGIDELQGNEGDDFLYGGDGNDILFGQEDDDELYGEDGMDQLVGGDGDDRLSGGLMDDALFGGAGIDILEGGEGADDLQGGGDNDILIGGSGDDLLFGGAGDDTYVITGSDGQDQITDTQGDNTLVFNILPTDLSISIENGLFFIDYAPGSYLFMSPETFNSITTIELGSGITLDPSYFLDLYQPGGSSGSNITLTPGASTSDLVIFGRNNDLVLVYTGAETDWLDTSTFYGRDVLFQEGDALDFGYTSSAPAVSLKNWFIANQPYLSFVNDNSGGFVNLIDNPSINRMFEGGDDESLWIGSDADDTFSGGNRRDIFDAGDGDDLISGGADADTLVGGPGNDTYFYNIGDDEDIISDESGFDTLQFGPGITQADLTITINSGLLSVQVGPTDGFDKILIAGWLDAADSPIDQFVFDGGATLTVDDINALITGNLQPELSAPLADVEFDYEQPFSFTIPAASFTDPNGDELTFVVGTPDGSALPSWLSFDPVTQTFSGTTPSQSGADIFDVVVTAFDPFGLPAADTFSFTVGLNLIVGTDGNDVLNGDASDNSIIGLAGDDDLFGGDGDDFLRGDDGRDDLFGDAGNDILDGGLGFDTLQGGTGNDTLIAGTNDGIGARLFGGDGDDIHIGGDGRDTFDGGDGANVYEIGIDGNTDTLEFIAPGTHTVRFGADAQLAELTASFEGFGSSFDMSIAYDPSNPTDILVVPRIFFRGTSGSDEVSPRVAVDPVHYVFEFEDGTSLTLPEMIDIAVIGTPGDDFLFPNGQNDAVFGGDGNDRILGRDFVFSDNSNTLFGEGGEDDISGGDGEDFISGGDGDDVLVGGDGDDTIVGGLDDDFLRGDDGNDSLDGGDGNDTLQGNAGNDILRGGAGDDRILGDLSFFSGSDQIFGGDGNDSIDGGGFADFIEGGAGDDIIAGGGSSVDARDMLRGGTGDDQFNDATGDGATHYLYDTGDGRDTISDTGHVDFINSQGIPVLLEDRFEFVEGSGIQLSDLQVTRVDDNLVLTASATDSITFQDWFLSVDNQIEEFITYDDLGVQIINTAADVEALIDTVNTAPVLDNPLADENANEGQAVNIVIPANTFSDPDAGDILGYSARLVGGAALPAWLTFDAATQTFSGTPPNNSNGSLDIEVTATDAGGLSVSDDFTLVIADANFAPQLDNAIADTSVAEDSVLNYTVPADAFSDSDPGDVLTYSAELSGGGALPLWLNFDAATRTFSGTPPNNSNGTIDIDVVATDGGGLTATGTFTLTVSDTNFAPTLENIIVDAAATEGQALSITIPANTFGDPDTGDALSYGAQLSGGGSLPAWLDFDTATRTFTGTPPNNSNGSIDVEVIATDSGGLSVSDTFALNIADANFAPTLDNAITDAAATEGQALNITVPVNTFGDPDAGDTLTYGAQLSGGGALPAWLNFDGPTRTFTGTPPNNSNGSIDAEVIATDSGGLSVSDTFALNIADANFAPTLDNAIADAGATEGQLFSLTVAADAFSDPDLGDVLNYSAQLAGGGALPAWLSFDAATRTFTGTPPNNSNGSIDIEVIASDAGGLSASDTFTLAVADANFAPTLDNPLADTGVVEGQAFSFVLAADAFSDPDVGDNLAYSAQLEGGGALPAWLSFDATTRTFSGTPPNSSAGDINIEVIASDGGGLSVSDIFTLTVNDTNVAPTLDNPIVDANATEGQPLTLTVAADTFSDPDAGDTLTYSAQLSGGGSLPAWLNFDAVTRTFTGTPPNNSNGSIDVEVVATDTGGLSASDTFTLAVADANFAPTLDNAIADANATEGEAFTMTVAANAFSDSDTGDTLAYSAQLSGGGALPAWLNFDAVTRTFTGTPPNNSNGSIDVEVVATDTGGLSASDTFTLAVADANFAPTLDNPIEDAGATEGQLFSLTVAADAFSDPDLGDALSYSAQLSGGGALPAWLSFDAANRTFSGTPPNGSNGDIDVEVIATDIGGLTATDTFTLSVSETNSAPTLDNPIADAGAFEGDALTFIVPANTFSDPDAGDSLTYSAQMDGGGALPGWLNFDTVTRTFTGTPPNNSNGSIDVEVIATDTGGLSVSDTFTLTIADTNFAPNLDIALADANAAEGQAFSLVVPANSFSDPDNGDVLTYTAQLGSGDVLPAWLSFDTATRTFTGTPPNNSSGSIDIEVIATDSGGLTATDTFTLVVADTNVAPTLDNAIADSNTAEADVFSYTIPADTFSDPDTGDSLTYSAQLNGGGALPAWLDFDATTRTFSGTPPNNSNGSIDIEVVATDSGGLSASDTFVLSIADTNFAPVLDNALTDANAAEGQAFNLVVPADTFSDPDSGDALTLSARLVGGAALPAWLSFDAVAGTFSGTPPAGAAGAIDVELIATDSGGLTVNDSFSISISDGTSVITGTDGDDVLVGTAAADQISGLGGDDILRGEGDDDLLDGGDGADMLFGGDGADTLIGGAGADDLYGGLGNDSLIGGSGRDELHGEEGDDNLRGGGGRDFIFGEDGSDTLSGGAGRDVMEGGLGDDILRGGDDNDVLRGGGGIDQLFGGAGDDTLRGGSGNDSLNGGVGNDNLRGQGGADIIFGDAGNDTIDGGGGADDIRGNAGDDDISGGAGNDVIRGNSGDDIVRGDEGNDELFGNGGADSLFGGDGNDTISGGGGNDNIRGNAGDDVISGGGGADTIRGNGGADTIQGGNGSDSLRGGGGRDVIDGGAGGDTIEGGAGRDTLSGGDGSDVYVFGVGDGSDTINNASIDTATDTLQIGTGITSGELAFSQSGSDLLIGVGTSGDTLRIEGWFNSAAQEIDFVETTDDGVVLTAADINAIVLGSSSQQSSVSQAAPNTFETFMGAMQDRDDLVPMNWDIENDKGRYSRSFGQRTRQRRYGFSSAHRETANDERRRANWFGQHAERGRDALPAYREIGNDEGRRSSWFGQRVGFRTTDETPIKVPGASTPPTPDGSPATPVSNSEADTDVSTNDRSRVLADGSVAPSMTDLSGLADAGSWPNLSSTPDAQTTLLGEQPSVVSPPTAGWRHFVDVDTEFETFRSAIEELDATTVAGAVGRIVMESAEELVGLTERVEETDANRNRDPVIVTNTHTNDIDRSLNQFIASIASFNDERGSIVDRISSGEDYETNPQITLPPV